MGHWTVRKAILSDLDDVKQLADNYKHELGFVMRPALQRAIQGEELLVAVNARELLGFVQYHHRRDGQTTLYNIAVKEGHRGKGVGKALSNALLAESRKLGKEFILLKCPEDLAANRFYQRIGYTKVEVEPGKARKLVIWKQRVDF